MSTPYATFPFDCSRRWNGVAIWRWCANDDTCGICRFPFHGCCPDCKYAGILCPKYTSKNPRSVDNYLSLLFIFFKIRLDFLLFCTWLKIFCIPRRREIDVFTVLRQRLITYSLCLDANRLMNPLCLGDDWFMCPPCYGDVCFFIFVATVLRRRLIYASTVFRRRLSAGVGRVHPLLPHPLHHEVAWHLTDSGWYLVVG